MDYLEAEIKEAIAKAKKRGYDLSESDAIRWIYEIRLSAFLEKYADEQEAKGNLERAEYIRIMIIPKWFHW